MKTVRRERIKSCPRCGWKPETSVRLPVGDNNIYIGIVSCGACRYTKHIAYSPGRVNKPKNAALTAVRLAVKEWNRRDA